MARILVIDDEIEIRKTLEHALSSAGYEVVLAADGEQGVNEQRARPVDLVVTDLVMPTQEGLETVIELRKDYPNLPIIAMSGMTAAQTLLTVAKRLGAAAILEKPFPAAQLLSVVDSVLRAKAGLAANKNVSVSLSFCAA